MKTALILFLLGTTSHSFSFSPSVRKRYSNVCLFFSSGGGGLILDDDEMEKQMAQLKSKYPTAEADYLAAARARNAAKMESKDCQATDEEWNAIKQTKQEAVGDIDDWEKSAQEAGNSDSQILIPISQDEEGEDEEPKLMLF